mmetsp:Transcript_37766/g.103786  ORF Transcript_37766/g.103786 Transcript_37766/m.103786 type:complete len:261 (-) Transcript_37766:1545-2327(-)
MLYKSVLSTTNLGSQGRRGRGTKGFVRRIHAMWIQTVPQRQPEALPATMRQRYGGSWAWPWRGCKAALAKAVPWHTAEPDAPRSQRTSTAIPAAFSAQRGGFARRRPPQEESLAHHRLVRRSLQSRREQPLRRGPPQNHRRTAKTLAARDNSQTSSESAAGRPPLSTSHLPVRGGRCEVPPPRRRWPYWPPPSCRRQDCRRLWTRLRPPRRTRAEPPARRNLPARDATASKWARYRRGPHRVCSRGPWPFASWRRKRRPE